MARRKRKYFINEEDSIKLFQEGYGLQAEKLNYYTIRLGYEEKPDTFWDWFHTQGTLCQTTKGLCKNIGEYGETEDVALKIKKILYYEQRLEHPTSLE